MIPTLIVVALLLGLLIPGRATLIAVPLLGIAWATLVATTNGAHFAGGFAFGAANAAVGVILGAGIRTRVMPQRNVKQPPHTGRLR